MSNSKPFKYAVWISLVACVSLIYATAEARGQSPASLTREAATVERRINELYEGGVEVVTAFAPFYVAGDFNSDGAQDVAAVVRLKRPRRGLAPGVKVVNPFGAREVTRAGQSSSGAGRGGALCLAVVHGSGAQGWRGARVAERHLLLGESPLLILDDERTKSNDKTEREKLISLIAQSRSRRRKYAYFRVPTAARGDWISVGTQVGDGLIYFDGRTYRFQDSPED